MLTFLTNSSVIASTEPPSGKFKSDGQRTRLNKRKVTSDALMQHREELFSGEFDGWAFRDQSFVVVSILVY